jgi:ParB-like chromosome segregation protein Spo0J
MKTMKIHPLCQMFNSIAPMPEKEHSELVEDIKANGIKVPILVNKKRDTILDGLTRWKIAYDLKLQLADDRFEVFQGSDDEIEAEILSRNLYRRHITDDQRVAIVSMLRGPQLEKEARARQAAAGGDKRSTASGENKISFSASGETADQIAKEAGVTQHKARQAEKLRKAGKLGDALAGKEKLHKAAATVDTKSGKPKKEIPFDDQVYRKWQAWIGRFAPSLRRQVMDLVRGWVGDLRTGTAQQGGAK